jgi:hypothetical protein
MSESDVLKIIALPAGAVVLWIVRSAVRTHRMFRNYRPGCGYVLK